MWNKIDPNKLKILGIALSIPSTVLVLAMVLMRLAENGLISQNVAFWLLIAIIFNFLILMVFYAIKGKNKS